MQSLDPDWDLDSDLEVRMSEFDSRLHAVEAANLQQNSTWFSRFQALETKLSQIVRRIDELPQPDAVQGGRQIAELRAAVETLAKTCTADKLEIKATIDATIDATTEACTNTQEQIAELTSHECEAAAAAALLVEQLRATVERSQQNISKSQQLRDQAQQRLEQEIAAVNCRCEKRAVQSSQQYEAAALADARGTESVESIIAELQQRISAAEAASKVRRQFFDEMRRELASCCTCCCT